MVYIKKYIYIPIFNDLRIINDKPVIISDKKYLFYGNDSLVLNV